MLDAVHMLTSNGDLSDHVITAIDECETLLPGLGLLQKYLGIERFPSYIQDIILRAPQNNKDNDFVVIAGNINSEDECLALDSE